MHEMRRFTTTGTAMEVWIATLVVVVALTLPSSAQTIAPTNTTNTNDASYGGPMEIGLRHTGSPFAVFPIIPLTQGGATDIAGNGLTGSIRLADAADPLNITSDDIVLISCDPYSGNIQPPEVFATAENHHAAAVVFYSQTAQSCHAAELGGYRWIYTLKSQNNSMDMLHVLQSMHGSSDAHPTYGTILNRDATTNTSSSASGNSSNAQQANPLGPSPSTAVAMIILYSITGVITALFLVIIITGAVRAHRHPERYGPRNGIGRPRQTRARGIARAMLDSIPIVKVGNRQDDQPKPTEVELESGQHGQMEYVGDQPRAADEAPQDDAAADDTTRNTNVPPTTTDGAAEESGIAAAVTSSEHLPTAQQEDHQGCSICTEDFEVGQDQRVLPCDHRFHPECIDPWLLNVSGTCPLCRIDLRPSDRESQETDTDEFGNPVRPEGEPLAPPLDSAQRRASVRRSLILGLMGVTRPERMTREERIRALREYRERNLASSQETEQDQSNSTAADASTTEAETSRRSRLRNAFRIRTRRTGEQPAIREEPQTASEPRRPEAARLPPETTEDRDAAQGSTEPASAAHETRS
ncbi:hypothetical protein AC578_3709 [Pseudocercospora eumusae]|uniref:RING-type domain-containing protein n=1 Tax=Pseudocercospora eumusae TaxID=321146 RepID=A0A139HT91_9PEZI|nr:hypothetical protein AC578_3709 [Pseudocercospora eumusae]